MPALQIHLLWQEHRAATLKPLPYVGGAHRSGRKFPLHSIASLIDRYIIDVEESGTPTAGQDYTLSCKVVVGEGMPTLQWTGPGVLTGRVTVGEQMGTGTTFTLPLTFSLLTSHGGKYTCLSTVGDAAVERTAMSTITVQSQ